MESFVVLKEKITLLVGHIKKLQSEKGGLAIENDALKVENAKLAEDNAQLVAKIKEAENSFAKESKEVEELNKEREFAKIAVDDLIKSIDGLVESEQQQ